MTQDDDESPPRHEVEIETVAEVAAVARQSVKASYYRDERIICLAASSPWRDYQQISWPVEKTPAVIAALQRIYDAEAQP